MKLLKTAGLALLALSFVSSVSADDIKTTHSVGLQWGGGGLEYKGKDTDDQGVGQSYLYYNYQFMHGIYAEVGISGAEDIEDWDCEKDSSGKIECFNDDTNHFEIDADDFDFGSIVIALKADLKLTKRNTLYAKAGAELYDYKFELERKEIVDEDGVGFMLETGWQYRWDGGIGINAAFQYHDLGDLEMNTFNVGVSYAF